MGKFTVIRYCKWCGDPFEVRSPNQKYCHPDDKNCSQESKRESWRKAASKYRKNYKNILQISQVYKLGSGLLGSTPKENFDEEYVAILKEKKRLKLNGMIFLSTGVQFTSRSLFQDVLRMDTAPMLELYPYFLVLAVVLVGFVVFGIYYK
ncbi:MULTISPECIES: hypothetical protein [Methanobacterium]|jgi:hypothetical protein|uniref:Uncharacterized protein n=1 Tax=Methanobacterium bryantii TaxID=2161 RepID=A0A2A2H583_METBR|nr:MULTISPECIES: hypothetical protein [Methanobacterium]OEC88287.1 hypothetical protein A9507_05050 [Methanobacterium sp. A39]PAV04476.1 hypothetical protein ASJ80_06465 [Methanobacterium bryantii]